MRVLIDTNILIYWEDHKIIDEDVQLFFKLSVYFKIFIDNGSINDIERDKDEERKEIIQSKLWKYLLSDFKLEPDDEFYGVITRPKKVNDKIDDKLLFTLKSWACDFLITEDKWIHSKALKLDIKDWVFSLSSFNKFILSLYPEEWSLESIKNVTHEKWYNVDPEASDEIFDSLKNDYPWFVNKWYKPNNKRKGFFLKSSEWLMWICLYDDNNDDYLDWIKISTFKVSDKRSWTKSWELLLRQIFLYALEKWKKYLYIEVKKDKYIVEWLKQFWFYEFWFKNWNKIELILKKDIFKSNIDRWLIFNYPFFFFWDKTNMFLIPIKSKYSSKLFPDLHSQLSLSVDDNICWNTIKKSYLSRSKIWLLNKWDIIFFYESSTWGGLREKNQQVIVFWVIDDVLLTKNEEEAIKFIWKRSVYNYHEIVNMLQWWLNIINFRYLDEIKNKITYEDLIREWIINWAPQTIQTIEWRHFNFLKKKLWSYYQ
jgi:rRNA-processing protein FCF1